MKIKLSFLVACALASLSFDAIAKEVNLYEQPQTNAKVVEKIDLSAGIVPIFTPKTGDWMKVGDPRNGNVGWVKTADLNDHATGTANVTFVQKVIEHGGTPYTYQSVQYGQPKLTSEQQQALQKMQMQQQAIQQSMQKAVQNLMNDMSTLYRHQMEIINEFPAVMPIIVMPPAKETTAPQQQPQPAAKPVTK